MYLNRIVSNNYT